MPPRSHTIFLVAAVSLAALNLGNVEIQVTSYLRTRQLPSTSLFRTAFWLWVPTAIASACAGLVGSYHAMRNNLLNNRYLYLFVIALCFVIKVDGTELRYSSFNFSFSLGVDRFSVGLNVLGVAAVAWLAKLRAGPSATGPMQLTTASPREDEGRAV